MAKIKDSEKEKLKSLYSNIHDAWKYNNTMTAVYFWDQFRDCFVHQGRSKESLHRAMVTEADTKKQRPPAANSKAYDKETVKSSTSGVDPAVDPEAPFTFLQFQILNSKMDR